MKKLFLVLAILVTTSSAYAQPSSDAGKPWASGVSPEDQKIASDLFKEGNALLRDANYNDALDAAQAAQREAEDAKKQVEQLLANEKARADRLQKQLKGQMIEDLN